MKIKNETIGACDQNWFKEYEQHYSNTWYCEPYCTRLELENGKSEYMGFVNIRTAPRTEVSSEVSECYLTPPSELTEDQQVFIKCGRKMKQYGLDVDCVPFIMPEGTLNVCAQASTWICLKILENISKRFVQSKDMPSIQSMATGVPWCDGYGLGLKSVSRLLHMNHCGTFYFNTDKSHLSDDDLINTVYGYVESGLPVILGVDVSKLYWWNIKDEKGNEKPHDPSYHAIVIIGHTMSDEGAVNGFIVHDESMFPYLRISKDQLLQAWKMVDEPRLIREAVMSVPAKVLVPFETANNVALAIVASLKKYKIPNFSYQLRPFLMLSESLFRFTILEEDQQELLEYALEKLEALPTYIWAFLLHTSGSKRLAREVDGLVLVDATIEPNLLLISLPALTIIQLGNQIIKVYFDSEHKPQTEVMGELPNA